MRLIEEQRQYGDRGGQGLKRGVFGARNLRKKLKDVVCYRCEKKGHIARHCRSKDSGREFPKGEKEDTEQRKAGAASSKDDSVGTTHKVVRVATARVEKVVAAKASTSGTSEDDIIADSGASEHLVNDLQYFENIESTERITIELADGNTATTNRHGTVRVALYESPGDQERSAKILKLLKFYYLPQLDMNLMSCTRLDQSNITTSFAQESCILYDRNNGCSVLGCARKKAADGLFTAKLLLPETDGAVSLSAKGSRKKNGAELWHLRLEHIGISAVKHMFNVTEYNMKLNECPDTQNCTTCLIANQQKQAASGKLVNDGEQHTIHTDICGPLNYFTKGGARYFVTFIVASSRYCDVGLLRSRSDMPDTLFNFIAWLERNTSVTVKRIHSDNAKEYVSLDSSLLEKGIWHTYSSAYTPQSNGLAERLNRTLLNKVRAMLRTSGLSNELSGGALLHASSLYNVTASKSLGSKAESD